MILHRAIYLRQWRRVKSCENTSPTSPPGERDKSFLATASPRVHRVNDSKRPMPAAGRDGFFLSFYLK